MQNRCWYRLCVGNVSLHLISLILFKPQNSPRIVTTFVGEDNDREATWLPSNLLRISSGSLRLHAGGLGYGPKL